MVHCTLMRKLSFLLWYTSLQYLVVYALDALVRNTTMSLGKLVVSTQFVWLVCTYLFAFGVGLHTKFVTVSEEEKQDKKSRESNGSGQHDQEARGDATTADHLMTAALSMLLVAMLAHWFALFASIAGTLYQPGDGMIRSLWGSTDAWVCVWVLFIMQSQLLVTTYLTTMHYTRAAPLGAGLQMSLSLYSVCHALLVLGFCAQSYTQEQTQDATNLDTPEEAQRQSVRYWLAHTPRAILVIVAAICTSADLVVNALILSKALSGGETTAALPDKRYLKIGLLWISLFTAVVILGMSPLGVYVLVVLLPLLALVVLISWHNYKTVEPPLMFSTRRSANSPAAAKTSDAFDAAASSPAIGHSSALLQPKTFPQQRTGASIKSATKKNPSAVPAASADFVYQVPPG